MIVFDFDKTMINNDSLFGFYRCTHKPGLVFSFKHFILLMIAIFYKLKLVSNSDLKRVGIMLFLRGRSKEELSIAAAKYKKKIKFNSIYSAKFLETPKAARLVVTASFEEYIRVLFPDDQILGSRLSYKGNKVNGLEVNCYGKQKVALVKEIFLVELIDELYTDSYSDLPLMQISKKVHLVKNGVILKTVENEI